VARFAISANALLNLSFADSGYRLSEVAPRIENDSTQIAI